MTVHPALVTTVATIASQPTATGREIHRMAALSDRVYLAYGDYAANTGPIHALALNPADDTITDEATFNTEETWVYREYAGTKYAAYLDPQGGDADFLNGQYATNDGTGWTIHTNVDPVPVHVLDLIVTAEGIFLFGAANTPDPPNGGATVWLSTDAGATWTTSLAPRPDPTNFARFYAACVIGTDLFTVLDDSVGGYHVYRRVAGAWTQPESISSPVSGLVPFTVNGIDFALIVPWAKQDGRSLSGTSTVLTAAEDAAHRPALLAALPPSVRDAVVYGGDLYIIDGDYVIWRVTASGVSQALFQSSVAVCSLAITGTTMYFGTTDSEVYKAPLPA